MNRAEQSRLEAIAIDSNYNQGINEKMIIYTANLFMRHMRQGNVLEMGPAHGLATDLLCRKYPDYSVVDAADYFVESIKERHPDIKGYVSLFEEFEPQETFDNIIMSHVLEHVENPVAILKRCKKWKRFGGVILAAVPNSGSLHRLAGVKLGMIDAASQLHGGDLKIGHRRVYSMESFVDDFRKAGFSIIKTGGYWLKPISNSQIEKNWSDDLIQAYMEMGENFPEIACNIYVVAE